MTLELPIEEYFRYHPPRTALRQSKHDLINHAALQLVLDPSLYESFSSVLRDTVKDHSCLQMAIASLQMARMLDASEYFSLEEIAKTWASYTERIEREELRMFFIQQARMFANQGITVDELIQAKTELAEPS